MFWKNLYQPKYFYFVMFDLIGQITLCDQCGVLSYLEGEAEEHKNDTDSSWGKTERNSQRSDMYQFLQNQSIPKILGLQLKTFLFDRFLNSAEPKNLQKKLRSSVPKSV